MKRVIFMLIIFFLFNNSCPALADNISGTSLSTNDFQWEYIVGDSPVDETGIPIRSKKDINPKNWLSCDAPQKGLKNINTNYLWLKTTLPLNGVNEAAIFLLTYDKAFEVYLDGKLIYGYGNFKTATDKRTPGTLWQILTLPEDYAGKTIYIRMFSYNKYRTGILGKFELAPKSSFAERIIRQDIDTVILVGLFIFVGLCSIIISILSKVKDNKKPFLFIGLFSVFIGLWLPSTVEISLYLLNFPLFWSYESLITLYLIPVWLCLFLKSILNKKYAALLSIIAMSALCYMLISVAGSIFRFFALPATLRYFHIFIIFMVIIIIYMTISSLFKGTKIGKTFGAGSILLYIFAITDILRWYTVVSYDFTLTQWGMLILVTVTTFSLLLQLAESQSKLKIYSEEIKLKEEILEEKKKLLSDMLNYDKMKTEFFVNISHELRTPLNIILSTLQLINLYIDKGQISTTQTELPRHLKVMKQNCYRLIRLVNNILDISKIDSGYMEPIFHRHDIVSAVEDTTLSTANYIKSNGIELYFDTDIEEKYMCFDRDKIERIILNLLSNAVKFSKPGSTIAVELLDIKDGVCISVKDTGIGMHKDTLEIIFERFVQADKSLSRAQEGSGIGLSLVKSIVEMHKGTITVESEYGKGSTFTVTLPSTLPETNKQEHEKLNLPPTSVEKVSLEFSDIYNF